MDKGLAIIMSLIVVLLVLWLYLLATVEDIEQRTPESPRPIMDSCKKIQLPDYNEYSFVNFPITKPQDYHFNFGPQEDENITRITRELLMLTSQLSEQNLKYRELSDYIQRYQECYSKVQILKVGIPLNTQNKPINQQELDSKLQEYKRAMEKQNELEIKKADYTRRIDQPTRQYEDLRYRYPEYFESDEQYCKRKFQAEINNLQNRLTQLKKEQSDTDTELQNIGNRIKALQLEIKGINLQQQNIRDEIAALKEILVLLVIPDQPSSQILFQQIHERIENLERLENRYRELFSTDTTDARRIQVMIDTVQNQKKTLQSLINSISINNLNLTLDEIESLIIELEQKLTGSLEQTKNITAQINLLQQEEKEIDQRKFNLTNEISIIQKNLLQLQEDLANCEKQLKEIQKLKNEYLRMKSDSERSLELTNVELLDLKLLIQRLREEIEKLTNRSINLEDEATFKQRSELKATARECIIFYKKIHELKRMTIFPDSYGNSKERIKSLSNQLIKQLDQTYNQNLFKPLELPQAQPRREIYMDL